MGSINEKLAKKYELLELLGEGATSAAYKAKRLSDGRLCVLKVFLKPLAEHEGHIRFDRECKALARLSHPNIVKMLEWGVVDGLPYLALEHMECQTLADFSSKGRMAWRKAVELVATMARALDYTHRQGMVHRDVKPQNILLLKDGSPMLIDFGLVRSGQMATYQTATGVVLGTPTYMAPELFGTEKATASSDIYALGIVLYELLSGSSPFTGSLEKTMKAKFKSPPPLPQRPGDEVIPKALTVLLMQLIESKPVNRYSGSGADLANALEQLLEGRYEKSALTTKKAGEGDKKGRSRTYWGLALLIPLLLVLMQQLLGTTANEELSAQWPLAKLGRYAQKNDSLNDLGPKKGCHVEIIGRLLRAKLQLQKDDGGAALKTLHPLLNDGRLGVVENQDELLKMAIKAVEGSARKDLGAAEEGDVLLLSLMRGKKRKSQDEKTLSLIMGHMLTLSKKRRLVAEMRCLLAERQRVAIDDEQFVKEAVPLLEESKEFGEESVVHTHAKLSAFKSKVIPLLVVWSALVYSNSSTFREGAEPWRLLLAEVKRLKEFPRVSLFNDSAFKQLSLVPFPSELAPSLVKFYEMLLRQQNSNANFRHGARLGWQNAYATLCFFKEGKTLDFEELKKECMDKQLLHRNLPFNLLPPRMLHGWIMYRSGCTMKRPKQSWPSLGVLDEKIFDFPGVIAAYLQVTLHLCSFGDEDFFQKAIHSLRKQLFEQKHPETKALIRATLVAIAAERSELPILTVLNDGKLTRFGHMARQFAWLDEKVLPRQLSDLEVGLLLLLTGRGKEGKQPDGTVQSAMARLLKSWSERKLGLPWMLRSLPILWTCGEWQDKALISLLSKVVSEPKSEEERLFILSTRCYQGPEGYFDFVEKLPNLRKGISLNRLAFFDQEQFFNLYRTRSLATQHFGSPTRASEAACAMLSVLLKSGEKANKDNVMVWLNMTLLLSEIVEYMDCITANNLRRGMAGFTRENKYPIVCMFARMALPIADSIPERDLPKGLAILLRLHRVRLHHYAHCEQPTAARILASFSPEDVPLVYRWFYWLWKLRLSVDGNGSREENLRISGIAKSLDYADTEEVLRVYMKAALRK